MKAAVLHGAKDLRVEEVPTPVPGDAEVLIRVRATSICGTDVHFFGEELAGEYPWVLGHDFSGVVERVGKDVDEFKIGDRVIAEIVRYCGACHFCKTGNYQLCLRADYMGFGVAGSFAEYTTAPAKNVFKIPGNVSFEEAAVMEPVALSLHVMGFLQPLPGEALAVVGVGPIGLVMGQAARLHCMRTVGIEPMSERRNLASDLGFDRVIDPHSEDPVASVKSFTNGLGANYVVEAVGKQETVDLADAVVRKGGKVVLVGARTGLHGPPVRHEDIITYAPSDGGVGNYPKALQLVSERKIIVQKLITRRAALAEAPKIFEDLSSGRSQEIKVVLTIPD